MDLTIDGPGAGQLSIGAGGKSGDFVVGPATLSSTTPAINVTIDGLTIANGSAAFGAGINATQANLTLDGDTLLDNTASYSGSRLHDTQSGVSKPTEDVLLCDFS